MDWSGKLGDLVLGGIGGVLSVAIPEHWRRRARERINDFNPWDVINGNHDLLRAARLAWVKAALDVLDAAKESADSASREFDSAKILPFEKLARETLLQIRHDALDLRTSPDASPIDRHIQVIMQGTSEFVAPGDDGGTDAELTQEFENTLAALTRYDVREIPGIFAQIARAGLPTIDGKVRRNFGDLVFAAFAELLKSRDKYPEALPAFNIAMDDAALKLTQAVLEKTKGLEDKLDQLLASADALKVFQTGAQEYLDALPKLLEGQARIEALVSLLPGISSKLDLVVSSIHRLVANIPAMHRANPDSAKQQIREDVGRLNAHLPRGVFEQAIASREARSLEDYRARRIAIWSQPDFALDKRFTPLTLRLDRGEDTPDRYQMDNRKFTDLRDVLNAIDSNTKDRVMVVTGDPGSGKSTLLRRLELDLASEALHTRSDDAPLTIYLELNNFGKGDSTAPEAKAWIADCWDRKTIGLGSFEEQLTRPLILLLDGLNEMPHASRQDFDRRLEEWKNFLNDLVRDHPLVRVVFSCRTLDYGARLPTKNVPRVPQVIVNKLSPEQVHEFLKCYSPQYADGLYAQLKGSPQLDLYSSPYYLKLLIEQAADGKIPEGRAALFTGYVRAILRREIFGENPRFQAGALLDERDLKMVRERRWSTPCQLPARGVLFTTLAAFAFRLQERRGPKDPAQVRVDYDRALENLSDVPANQQDELLKAAADLQILELPGDDVLFVHQLLQEYFAARHVAERVSAVAAVEAVTEFARLAQVKWLEKDIQPSVAEELQTLPKSGTLPDLDTTGWEETFTLAAALLLAPDAFLRALAQYNLPLAGRSAAQSDVKVSQNQINELRKALLERSRDPATDLRARISAGLALGALGDPRFEAGQGPGGRGYLLPPLVALDGGSYTIGSNDGIEEDETPVHVVDDLAPFCLGQFPVTNAEYGCFIDAGGYDDPGWWGSDADAAERWRQGEGTAEAARNNWRIWRDRFKREAGLLERLNDEQAWPKGQLGQWQSYCAMTDEDFESVLRDRFRDQRFTEPRFWHDAAYNAPNQPVVGVCWYEARAYCAWLSAQTGQPFRLPSEAEWEAAARGKTRPSDDGQPLTEGRRYAWGNDDKFFSTCCNTLETKLRRTTPIGVFPDGDTPAGTKPNGLADMTGNVWEWTSSVYDQEKYRYPYKADDGREDDGVDSPRVLRGGSWDDDRGLCRCAYRYGLDPSSRYSLYGFRVCCAPPII